MTVPLAEAQPAPAGRGLAVRDWRVMTLLAGVAVALAVHLWWLHRFRLGYPLDIDESRYLAFGLRLSDGLSAGGPAGFWHQWAAQRDFGPLLPLVTVPVYALLGQGIFAALTTQLLFFVLLVVSSYGLGARLSSRGGGLVVALLVASTPAVVDYTRTYQFALTDAAVLAAATYALLASEGLSRRGWSCVWGVLVGLSPLARTMAIAFVPAQLIAAAWLCSVRPGPRRRRWVNLALGVGLGALAAASWLSLSWHSVYSYLTGFGYGGESTHFGHAGSRLGIGYWTREARALVQEDLYLPLAMLLAISMLAAGGSWLRRQRGAAPRGRAGAAARRWSAGDAAVVLFCLFEGYLAVSSSSNEGVGFRVPLLAPLLALAVAALMSLPQVAVRRGLIAGLVAVGALNFVMKADVLPGASRTRTASVPGIGTVPVLSGQGYIQGYVLSSLEAQPGPPTQPLPASARGWLPAYAGIAGLGTRLARMAGDAPVVGLATDEPLLNANDLILAAQLHEHLTLPVDLVAGPPAPPALAAYGRLLRTGPMVPDILVTTTHVGLSYFALTGLHDIDQGLMERAAAGLGFRCAGAVALPDGRQAIVFARSGQRPSGALVPPACGPRVTRVVPGAGSTVAAGSAPVVVLFSLPMAWPSLGRAFTLTERGGARIPGRVTPFGGFGLVFKPARPLGAGSSYTATVGAGATAATGLRLPSRYRWSFTAR